jgi:hypothetical protein
VASACDASDAAPAITGNQGTTTKHESPLIIQGHLTSDNVRPAVVR